MIKNIPLIDYRTWILGDKARKGINLMRLGILDNLERDVFELAYPFQDKRNDAGQAEIVTYFAHYLASDEKRNIAKLSAILHDTGWYGTDSGEWKRKVDELGAGNPALDSNSLLRRPHQNKGLILAGYVLNGAGFFDASKLLEIADNIGDHDTREFKPSKSGKVLQDADEIWRFTIPCTLAYQNTLENPNEIWRIIPRHITDDGGYASGHLKSYSEIFEVFQNELDKNRFNLPESKKVARMEFANTLYNLFPEKTKSHLPETHLFKEFEIVKGFYSK